MYISFLQFSSSYAAEQIDAVLSLFSSIASDENITSGSVDSDVIQNCSASDLDMYVYVHSFCLLFFLFQATINIQRGGVPECGEYSDACFRIFIAFFAPFNEFIMYTYVGQRHAVFQRDLFILQPCTLYLCIIYTYM